MPNTEHIPVFMSLSRLARHFGMSRPALRRLLSDAGEHGHGVSPKFTLHNVEKAQAIVESAGPNDAPEMKRREPAETA